MKTQKEYKNVSIIQVLSNEDTWPFKIGSTMLDLDSYYKAALDLLGSMLLKLIRNVQLKAYCTIFSDMHFLICC
jgi:hypothetical protein